MRIEHAAFWANELERLRAFSEHSLGARAGERYENAATGGSSYLLELGGGAS
jgi:catechol 2,3-dioxygenase-like lactoylglutathione lyase family enzyme